MVYRDETLPPLVLDGRPTAAAADWIRDFIAVEAAAAATAAPPGRAPRP